MQTVNDIIVGLIFFGTRLCMQEISHKSSNADSTALVLLNTRKARSYKSIKEMVGDSGASWGNKIAFLHVPIPKFKDPKFSNPLEYVCVGSTKDNQEEENLIGCLSH